MLLTVGFVWIFVYNKIILIWLKIWKRIYFYMFVNFFIIKNNVNEYKLKLNKKEYSMSINKRLQ